MLVENSGTAEDSETRSGSQGRLTQAPSSLLHSALPWELCPVPMGPSPVPTQTITACMH